MPDILNTMLPLIAIFAVFYLLMIRPQQRKVREQQERVASLEPGTRVMTASGVFGTIRHIGERQAVIEISPGIEMTIIKGAITKVVGPNEEEFEYDDADADADADAATVEGELAEEELAEAVADDDGFDRAIAGFDGPSAPDPQSDEDVPDPRAGESK